MTTHVAARRAAVAALALAATAAWGQAHDVGTREFEGNCASCRGKDGRGGGPYAGDLDRSPGT